MIAIRRYLMDTEITQLMEAPNCEVKGFSEHENHTSEEGATSDYDANNVIQTIDNAQHIQSKHQNINWSLDQPPRFGCMNSVHFMKTSLSVARYSTSRKGL
ncbi:hypothetical protein AVEN_150134-1 [Araneus ventricosus]|uniref:Uncharacterized protein n=1 Tax=Araneus ventricosus TaxID=182803 RepID=A0A4Y2P803_ARAVE|nr:hypothetical protein AVEN_150134-1 [Araneus ventricosus]